MSLGLRTLSCGGLRRPLQDIPTAIGRCLNGEARSEYPAQTPRSLRASESRFVRRPLLSTVTTILQVFQ
jgi:hypothetical protein